MANIDSQINDRMQTYSGNPQALQQRYAQTQELVDLLALQKMKNDRAAATSAVQGAMQTDTSTYKGQLEQEAMQGARSDVMRSMGPGIQQQGQRMAQMQNRAAVGMPTTGLPAQPAPNMRGMAMGGIVGYAQGGQPMMGPPEPNMLQRMGQGLKNYGTNANESMGILQEAKAGMGVPYENRSAAIKQVRDEIEAQNQNRDPNFIERMGQKLMDTGLNVEESKSILKKFYNNMGKTYEQKANGMAMGGAIRGYAGGGEIRAYLSSIGRDIADFSQEQIAAISQMLDSQVARGQNDTLRGVGRGAIEVLRDRMPSGATSDAARDFNRETMQARNERDRSPSLTDQLNAAQRGINAENSASMQDVMTSPDNNMGIANILGGIRDFSAERDPRKSTMGRTIYDQAKKDLGRARDFVSERNPMNSNMGRTIYDSAKEDLGNLFGGGNGGDKTGFMQAVRNTFNPNLESGIRPRESLFGGLETRTPTNQSATLPQNEGITAGMYDVRSGMPTDRQKLGSMVDKPSAVFRDNMAERAGEKPKREMDLRPLREFLLGGAGQTSTAGALAGGARGLGAFQTAEQGRLDKIAQAGADRKMRKDLLDAEYAFRDKIARDEIRGRASLAEQETMLGLRSEAIASLNSNPQYAARVAEIKENADNFGPAFYSGMDEAQFASDLATLREEFIGKYMKEATGIGSMGGSTADLAAADAIVNSGI